MPLESNTRKGRYWEQTSLPVIGSLTPGSYNNPVLTVDEYGRITSISSSPISGQIHGLNDGSPVPNGPFGIINFIGPGVSAYDGGGGTIDVLIPGGGSGIAVEEEGTLVIGGPHMILNFEGTNVTASNDGLGRVNVVVSDQPNSVRFRTATINTAAINSVGSPIGETEIVRRVTVTVTTAYDPGTTILVRDGLGTVYMPTTGNNPQLVGSYEYEIPANTTAVGVGGEQLYADVGGGPTTGEAIVEVRYHTP